ncbi:MAG: glycosyltransferase [Proteobacteria bacterium]|nr:glycosyltransferase [Pseudomonadota bacterium]
MNKRPLKVCIATPEFPPASWGGLARSVGRTAGYLKKSGLEVQVAHFVFENRRDILLDENRHSEHCRGVRVHRIHLGRESMPATGREIWDCPHDLTLQMMYQSLELLHLEERFDFFQSYFLYPVGYVTGLLAARHGLPTAAALVGNDVKKYLFSPEKAALCRSGLENADRVVCLSRELLELANALTPIRAKARVIYNSVQLPAEGRSHGHVGKPPFRIGAAGIFKYAKGLPYLFKAVADLRSRLPVVLELRGEVRPSERRGFHDWIEKTGIRDLVRLEPPLPHEDVFTWLKTLDVFVLSSVSEGCPNILMEAMSVGLPCVAARVGAVEDLMVDGVDGRVVPWGRTRDISDAVEDILTRPDRGESLGRSARERMKAFSPQREWAAWDALYREMLDF